jgi:hypothetical protein
LFDQLLALYSNADEQAKPEIQRKMEELTKPGESPELVDIIDFIDQALGQTNRPTTRFQVDRPVR